MKNHYSFQISNDTSMKNQLCILDQNHKKYVINLSMQAVPFLSLTSVFNCQINSVYFHIFLKLRDKKNFLSELFSFLMICLTVNKLRKCQTTQPIFSANLAFFTNFCSYNLLLVETITKQSYDNIQIKARKSKPKEEFENM